MSTPKRRPQSPAPTLTPTSERTPLLSTTQDEAAPQAETPLPKAQIALLTITRASEPIAFAILLPFVNEMVLRTGEVTVEQTGYWVGLIESLFSFTSMLVLMPWGYAADKYGRKPVLLISLTGTIVSTICFGFSTKIWQMIVARCIAGAFSGSGVVVRTLFSEISDKSNQARVFSWFAFANNMGLFLGPTLGGALADPARQFPNTIGSLSIFQHYPYALPCLVCALYISLSLIANFLWLEEPVHRERAERQPLRALLNATLGKVFLIFSVAMFLGLAYTAVLPLYAFTPVDLGGLALRPPHIAALMALAGVSQSIWLLFAMPPLDKKLGTRRLLRICFLAWPWFFVTPVLSNIMAKRGNWTGAYALMCGTTMFGSGVSIAFTSVQLLINNASPPGALGTVNGFALTLMSLIRTIAPATMTSIFAFGVEHNVMGRYLAWFVMWTVATLGIGISALAPRDERPNVQKPAANASEEGNAPRTQ